MHSLHIHSMAAHGCSTDAHNTPVATHWLGQHLCYSLVQLIGYGYLRDIVWKYFEVYQVLLVYIDLPTCIKHLQTYTHANNKTVHMLPTCSKIPVLLQLYTHKQSLTYFITSTNLESLYIYGANKMLLHTASLLTYSKHKQCNHQDTKSDVQQHNIHITNNKIRIIILLEFHYMPANSYCSVLH